MDNKSSGTGLAKVLVVGHAATGKTSLIRRYCRNEFNSDYQTTIGVDFSLKAVSTDGVDLNVQLWDIAGQERFAGLSRIFYTHAVGAIVVFDMWERETFNAAAMWKKDIDSKVFFNGEKIPVILLANKCDLIDEDRKPPITPELIDHFCKEHDFFASFQVSAKTGVNVKEACHSLIQKIIANNKAAHAAQAAQKKSEQVPEQPKSAETIKLKSESTTETAKNTSACCS